VVILIAAGRTWPLRGREEQLDKIDSLINGAVKTGQSRAVMIEGSSGAGKSRLLADAARSAEERGFEVVRGEAEELRWAAPLSPVFAVLGETPPIRPTDRRYNDGALLIEQMRSCLRQRASRGSVLVALDDLHNADPLTLMALRTVSSVLATVPVVWLVTRRLGEGEAELDRLFSDFERRGTALHLELCPLSGEAVTELVTDLIDAQPGPDVRNLAEAADGNPLALVELVRGLIEEGMVRWDGRVASLAIPPEAATGEERGWEYSIRPPARFRTLLCRQLDALPSQTRLLLEVAALLGMEFMPDDLAEMLGLSPAALLPALQEALALRVLVCSADRLVFRHELIRRTLLDSIPLPARAALHRQAAEILLNRGSPTVDVAYHIVNGASSADADAAQKLSLAAVEVLATSPRAAARLANRGLELCGPVEPVHQALTAIAVESMTRSGPVPEAITLGRTAPHPPRSPAGTVSVRNWLSTALLFAGKPECAVAIVEDLLASPDLPEELYVAAVANHLIGLAQLGAPDATRHAESVLGQDQHIDDLAACGMAVIAASRWNDGNLAEALRLGCEAVDRGCTGATSVWAVHPALTLAGLYLVLGESDRASALLDLADGLIERPGGAPVLGGVIRMLRSRLLLFAGDLTGAVTEADAAIAATSRHGVMLYQSTAWGVLATAALREGNLATAGAHLDRLRQVAGSNGSWPFPNWIAAQIAAASVGPEAAMDVLSADADSTGWWRSLVVHDPAAAAWCVRTAHAAGRTRTASAVVAVAERLAEQNPDVVVLAAAAAHAKGLHERDPAALSLATRAAHDPWVRASATEDLAVALLDADHDRAVEYLDTAMTSYGRAGADRDAARVRRRLRRMGVRRRHWSYADRPTSGWASLTETEQTVARLVAQGLTNRKVAGQMFVSPHTVGFHLRQIFRKLGVRSRVDLLRVGAEEHGQLARSEIAATGLPDGSLNGSLSARPRMYR
jgi:DNA-binding CsgD family transcriptional regulator